MPTCPEVLPYGDELSTHILQHTQFLTMRLGIGPGLRARAMGTCGLGLWGHVMLQRLGPGLGARAMGTCDVTEARARARG